MLLPKNGPDHNFAIQQLNVSRVDISPIVGFLEVGWNFRHSYIGCWNRQCVRVREFSRTSKIIHLQNLQEGVFITAYSQPNRTVSGCFAGNNDLNQYTHPDREIGCDRCKIWMIQMPSCRAICSNCSRVLLSIPATRPQTRSVSAASLLVASMPILPPSPGLGLAKSM